jgi:hypothetical protein
VRAEWARNRSMALRAALNDTGLTREVMDDWMQRDPRAFPFYLQVLWCAAMNGHDKTLRAMAAVLGVAAHASATEEVDAFDDAELALRAMADLTPRHFRVLAALVQGEVAVSPDGGHENYGQFSPRTIAERAGLDEPVTVQCLVNLTGAGLATQASAYGGMVYPVTELGRAVARAAERVADEP